MTREEFNKTGFGSNMKAIYDGVKYNLVSVSFTEGLVGMNTEHEEELIWVRCENIELV